MGLELLLHPAGSAFLKRAASPEGTKCWSGSIFPHGPEVPWL